MHVRPALTAGTAFTTGARAPTTNGGAVVSLEVRAASMACVTGFHGFFGCF